MTLSLLYKPGSVNLGLILGGAQQQLGSAGSVLLKPDTGQYWLPILIHVGTRNGAPCRADLCSGSIAALQAGNKNFATPGALSDPSTIKDFTSLGANDTSSILSGTIIAPGEGIQVNFYNGLGADVGYVELWGTSSDVPPLEGTEPLVPGARFTGSNNAGETPTASPSFQLDSWPGSAFFAPGAIDTSASNMDMRGYSSYRVLITAVKQGFTSANFDPVQVQLSWFDSSGTFLYHETFVWFADDRGGVAVPQNWGTFELQDAVHGEFLNVGIQNQGSIDNLAWSGEVRGSVRQLGRAYLRNAVSTTVAAKSGTLFDSIYSFGNNINIGAGASITYIVPLRPGRAHLWLFASANGINVNIFDALAGQFEQLACLTGNNRLDFVQGSNALTVQISNTTGGVINFFAGMAWEKPSQGT